MEHNIEIIDILLQTLNYKALAPYSPKTKYLYSIKYNCEWNLNDDKKMLFSSINVNFEGADKKSNELSLNVNFVYFAGINNTFGITDKIEEDLIELLDTHVKSIIMSFFIRDINDLFLKSGYPAIGIGDLHQMFMYEID